MVINSTDWAEHNAQPPNPNLSGIFFKKHDGFFLTSFQSEALQQFTGCEVVKAALSLCRFWLQFSTEDGPGPGSAISLDNISFSMDCFLACEYCNDVESVYFVRPWLNYWSCKTDCQIDWPSQAQWGGKIKLMINTGLPYVHVLQRNYLTEHCCTVWRIHEGLKEWFIHFNSLDIIEYIVYLYLRHNFFTIQHYKNVSLTHQLLVPQLCLKTHWRYFMKIICIIAFL